VPIASERCPTDEAGPDLTQRSDPSVEVHMAPIEQNEPVVEEAPLVEETLVEEVSIDGMCGVY
jgi:mycofactocin precursor